MGVVERALQTVNKVDSVNQVWLPRCKRVSVTAFAYLTYTDQKESTLAPSLSTVIRMFNRD